MLISAGISAAAENAPFYQKWRKAHKFIAMMMVCLIIPLIALMLQILIGYVTVADKASAAEIIWESLRAGLAAWGITQATLNGMRISK